MHKGKVSYKSNFVPGQFIDISWIIFCFVLFLAVGFAIALSANVQYSGQISNCIVLSVTMNLSGTKNLEMLSSSLKDLLLKPIHKHLVY